MLPRKRPGRAPANLPPGVAENLFATVAPRGAVLKVIASAKIAEEPKTAEIPRVADPSICVGGDSAGVAASNGRATSAPTAMAARIRNPLVLILHLLFPSSSSRHLAE